METTMATRKNAAKRPTSRKKITIQIDLGSFEATPEELFRLKEFVNNQVLTWAKYDTKAATDCLVTSREGATPSPED
jgi:hypothetical protein